MRDDQGKLSKIVFLGPVSSGKSSLIIRMTNNSFLEHVMQTIGTDFASYKFDSGTDSERALQIWDIAGTFAPASDSIFRTCFKEARALIFTIDCSSEGTIVAGLKYCQKLKGAAATLGDEFSNPAVRKILVLTKADLNPGFDKAGIHRRFLETGLQLSSDSIEDVFATSAKQSIGTNEFRAYLGEHCFEPVASASASASAGAPVSAPTPAAAPAAAAMSAAGGREDTAEGDTSCWAGIFCCPPEKDDAAIPLAPATGATYGG